LSATIPATVNEKTVRELDTVIYYCYNRDSMEHELSKLWTLDELGQQVARALSVEYEGQANGRVRDVPDRRTIRYYTTLGLIDRATRMCGRTALYGRRHLLQLVAIKRLQATGLSLTQLQQRLLGLPDSQLAEIARLPGCLDKSLSEATPPEPDETRSENFWQSIPVPPPAVAEPLLSVQGIRLERDVTLLLSPSRPLETDDVETIRRAAAPLLRALKKRGLLRSPS
jgi:DNA-binding transcriptional MerR regulator